LAIVRSFDETRTLQLADRAADGFVGQTEIIGDVLPVHRSIDEIVLIQPDAVRQKQKERDHPFLGGLTAQNGKMILHVAEALRHERRKAAAHARPFLAEGRNRALRIGHEYDVGYRFGREAMLFEVQDAEEITGKRELYDVAPARCLHSLTTPLTTL
jgi:hypothetical protein